MTTSVKQRAKLAAWVLVAAAVALAPVGVSAAGQTATSSTTINATVNDVISITSGPTVAISLTPTSAGVISSASDNVSVSTNNTGGYTLSMKDSDATTTLTSGANTIATRGSTTAAAALANGEWGWAVPSTTIGVSVTGFDTTYSALSNSAVVTSKWAGVAASGGTAATIRTTSTNASGSATTVWYAARVNDTQATGTYSDTVTYTATTN